MCDYCENGKLIYGGDGYFRIAKRTLRRRDGETQEQPILKYEASDAVFSTEIEIDDHFVINNCPMCGRELIERNLEFASAPNMRDKNADAAYERGRLDERFQQRLMKGAC